MLIIKNKSSKKQLISIFTIITVFVLSGQTIAHTIEFKNVDPNEIPEQLATMSSVVKANYDKIKSWEGKILYECMIFYRGKSAADILKNVSGAEEANEPNELARKSEGTHEFKFDVKNNRMFIYYTSTRPVEYIDLSTQLTYTDLSSDQWAIKTNDYQMICYPDRLKKDGTILHKKAIKYSAEPQPFWSSNPPITKPGAPYQPVVWGSDPRGFFQVGTPVWVLLSQLSETLRLYRQGDIDSVFNVMLEKSTEGKMYRVKIANPCENQWYTIFVLDGTKGFNPINIENKYPNGVTLSEISTEFFEIQSVFLPKTSRLVRYEGDSSLKEISTVTLSDMQINMSLPENTFTINNLGLQDGDNFVDKTANKEYTYQGGELVEIETTKK